MSFIYESPASDWVKNRYDWTSIPLLYQGEAGSFCRVPDSATVDKERDIIFFLGGGGMGRTSGEFQPYTHILLWKGVSIRCQIEIVYSYENQDFKKVIGKTYRLSNVHLPTDLTDCIEEILIAFRDIALVDECVTFFKGEKRDFDPTAIKVIEVSND